MATELGLAKAIDAESFGDPGKRTFRLRIIGSNGEAVALWVDKQHIVALSVALEQTLSQLGYKAETAPPSGQAFPPSSEIEFHVGHMSMGFHEPDSTVVFVAYELTEESELSAGVKVRLSQEHCAALRQRLNDIIASGRPVCQLCGLPIDSDGHMCVRANGHSEQPIPS